MENKEEIWKDIIGYEGLYKISSLGNVASVDRYVKSPLHKTGVRIHYGKQLKIDIPRAGSRYITFKVSSNGKSKTLILQNGSESPLISFAVGGMKATQYKDSNFLNKFCLFFKLLYICIYL